MYNTLSKKVVVIFAIFIFTTSKANFSAHSEYNNEAIEPMQEPNFTWENLHEYLSFFDEDSLSHKKQVSIGFVLLVASYIVSDLSVATSDLLSAFSIYFLTNGMERGFANYIDNFEHKNLAYIKKKASRSAENHYKINNHNKNNKTDYKTTRIRFTNCLKSSVNLGITGYLFFNLPTKDMLFIVCHGSNFIYHTCKLINNINSNEILEENPPVINLISSISLCKFTDSYFAKTNGLSLSFCRKVSKVKDLQLLHPEFKIEQNVENIFLKCESFSPLGNLVKTKTAEYAVALFLVSSGKLLWNIGASGYKYWCNKKDLESLVQVQNELVLEGLNDVLPDLAPVTKKNKNNNNTIVVDFADTSFFPHKAQLLLDEPANIEPPTLKFPEISTGANYQQPRKPKHKRKITNTNQHDKQSKLQLSEDDNDRIKLIKEAFSFSNHTKVEGNKMENLAKRAAKHLGGRSFIEGGRYKISWNNGQKKDRKVSFELAHNPSSYEGYKKTKAIKAVIKVLIADVEEEKLELYKKQLKGENSAWRLAMKTLFERRK